MCALNYIVLLSLNTFCEMDFFSMISHLLLITFFLFFFFSVCACFGFFSPANRGSLMTFALVSLKKCIWGSKIKSFSVL